MKEREERMPMELERIFKEEQENRKVHSAMVNEEALERYQKACVLAKQLFPNSNVTYTDFEEKAKVHMIHIKAECYELEGNEVMKKLGTLFACVDSAIIDATANGEYTCISLYVDDVYLENRFIYKM